ncbi:hypothetical protein AW40_04015 [Kosakonia radicincitans UMEnt01/12]|nr:hypothetical protein AW40_04015 [Kosakonia radicincitans UMEnt01/12]
MKAANTVAARTAKIRAVFKGSFAGRQEPASEPWDVRYSVYVVVIHGEVSITMLKGSRCRTAQ